MSDSGEKDAEFAEKDQHMEIFLSIQHLAMTREAPLSFADRIVTRRKGIECPLGRMRHGIE